jgi:hypothetical protein
MPGKRSKQDIRRYLIGKHPDNIRGVRHATNYHGNVSHQLITTIIVVILVIFVIAYIF